MHRRRFFFSSLLLLLLILLFTFLLTTVSSLFSKAEHIPAESGSVDLFFCPLDDCEEVLAAAIREASDVRCAFYELNLEQVKAALAKKGEEHAQVLVFDEEYEEFGIPVPNVKSGLMHDKFCILDGKKVVTGSMNPTQNDAKKNNNNLLIIEGELLAQNYLDEFDELRARTSVVGGFGAGETGERTVQTPIVNHTDTKTNRTFLIENYFCPEDGCEREVLKELQSATTSIRFLTFSFTSEAIGDLLVEKSARGIPVLGVFERRQESKYSEYTSLKAAGLAVRLDGNPATMHHKVFLIDAELPFATVVLGSYNPTANGNTRNDENLLIIHDQGIAQRFQEEFERVYAAGAAGE